MRKFMLKIFIAFAILLLVACGDSGTTENITQNIQTGLDIVASAADLQKCNKDNDGEQVFVKAESGIRVCADGKWYAVSGSDSLNIKGLCTTEALSDSSGVKIICGGDSVGVVLNGADGIDGAQGETGVSGADGKDGTNGKDGSSCTVETLADDSGLKVLCGGDSVGVVLNGASGSNGKDGSDGKDGANSVTSCALVTVDCVINVVCGTDTVSMGVTSTDESCQEVVVLDSEKIAIALDTVSGVTQKGPFLMGSRVLVKELSDGRALTQTGNTFDGKILNDNGQFKITARMLVSQYVMVQAEGFYRNEVTGQNSDAPLTLYAITDVNDRNIVNINLLTHLEYDRVFYLVTKLNKKVKAAKKIAEMEIFDILGINATGFSNSEDLNIAGSSDEDAALLAFSVMLQGDYTVSELSELLTAISTDMEQDGSWDDADARGDIAYWVAHADLDGRLPQIRSNVENWGLSQMVPNFEKYMRAYWSSEYGLGVCGSDSVPIHTIANATNMNGKAKNDFAPNFNDTTYSKIRFACESNGMWRLATDFEKDTLGFRESKRTFADGQVEMGPISGKLYAYDAGNDAWNEASTMEKDLFGYEVPCIENGKLLDGNFVSENKYVCEAGSYRKANDMEQLAHLGCISETADSIRMLDGQYSFYKCNGSWVLTTDTLYRGTAYDYNDMSCCKNEQSYPHEYKTIGIGKQLWMAENLDHPYRNLRYKDTENCFGGTSSDSCEKYGRLYTWSDVVDSLGTVTTDTKGCGYGVVCNISKPVRGICMEGWHVPDSTEWQELVDFVGGVDIAGKMLKSTTGWNANNGEDRYGFNAIPTGLDIRTTYTEKVIGDRAEWWTLNKGEFSGRTAMMSSSDDDFTYNLASLGYKRYLRCVKDE